MFPKDIVFTIHARNRARQRGIDSMKLRRQLAVLPYDEELGKRIWYIPKTRLYVVFRDMSYERVVITVVDRDKK